MASYLKPCNARKETNHVLRTEPQQQNEEGREGRDSLVANDIPSKASARIRSSCTRLLRRVLGPHTTQEQNQDVRIPKVAVCLCLPLPVPKFFCNLQIFLVVFERLLKFAHIEARIPKLIVHCTQHLRVGHNARRESGGMGAVR